MSKKNITILPGSAYPLGVIGYGDDVEVSARYRGTKNCGIALFTEDPSEDPTILLFDESCRTGRLFSAILKDVRDIYDSYLLYEDGAFFVDPYARKIVGLEQFGEVVPEEKLRCRSLLPPYDWRGDIRPQIPYEDSFICCLNVRAYTMQDTSVKKKEERGTFKALCAKIPYLKSLGVTAVELMPIHEIHTATRRALPGDAPAIFMDEGAIVRDYTEEIRPNLWGYQDGYYFAPRASYSTNKLNPCNECKDMIRAFHDAGMEVLLQFYFAPGTSKNLMVDCIRYWVSEYHIDGFHLKSDNIPVDIIASDPMLHDLKIMSGNPDAFRDVAMDAPLYLAKYGGDFTWRARRFLKGDDLSASELADAMYMHVSQYASIHFICNYDGFTLRDLVTYEHKRNDENGERGSDGRNDNYAWNCGVEGETRKKAVNALRRKQMRNAVTLVMLTRQTPLLYAGDESGNTQNGNNNPYCQDNRTGWTDRDRNGKYRTLTEYVAFLASLRRRYRVLRERPLLQAPAGTMKPYPDLSFHGAEAWKPDFSDTSHSFGVLYSDTASGEYLYVTYNMYWEETSFAMPALPSGFCWMQLADTEKEEAVLEKPEKVRGLTTVNAARSIRIFAGIRQEKKKNERTD
ncbi:MAG: hypothetical protein IJQ12_08295 [Lachnospiraceae bacterium]|nr:hypothetical protein [Lachnospiraceae bacterium]